MEVLMLAGIPTSGKSTFIKNLQKKKYWSSAVILSTDNYIEKAAKTKNVTYDEIFEEAITPAHKFLSHQLKMAIESQTPIIWDQTNLTVKSRERKLNQLPDWWTRSCVYFEIGLEEAFSRNKNRSGKFIPEEVIERMFYQFQIPSYSESFEFISTSKNYEKF